jgi:hypothetical protein
MRNNMKNDYDADEEVALDDLEGSGLRWMSVAVVLLVVAGFFALAWYAYRSSSADSSGEHLVKAEAGPLKEKPADPGGMQTPYQDMSVYNVISPDGQKKDEVEQLLPEPEEPIAVRQEPKAEPGRTSGDLKVWQKDEGEVAEIPDAPAQEKLLPPPAAPAEQTAAETDAPAATTPPVIRPKRFMEKTDDSETESSSMQEKPVKVTEAPVVLTPAPAAPEKPKVEAAPKPAPAAKSEPKPTPALAKAESKPAAQPAPVTVSKETGNVQVQLAALKTSAEATATWAQLKKKHGDVLAGRQYLIVKAELPQGTFYRLRVSGLGPNAAKDLCAALSARRQSCMVVR